MNERGQWEAYWLGRDLYAFVERRDEVVDPVAGVLGTAWVLDVVRAGDVQPLLGGGAGARREIPFLGVVQVCFTHSGPQPALLAAATEGTWTKARVGAAEAFDATVFRDLDGVASLSTKVSVLDLDDATRDKLHSLISLDDVPDATDDELKLKIEAVSHVAVINVGQGNSNALRARDGAAQIYFDLGGGCLWNAHTMPASLAFCFTRSPPIVLSHWDFDHWFGATLPSAVAQARECRWIAPRQKIGPRTLAFASTLHALGTLRLWPAARREVRLRYATIVPCSGVTKNDGGLAVFVKAALGTVLSTGDAAFEFVPRPTHAPHALIGLVVPHHGSPRSVAPPIFAAAPGARAAFSYGARNTYGHPGSSPSTLATAGWNQQFATPVGGIALGGPARGAPCRGQCSIGTVQP